MTVPAPGPFDWSTRTTTATAPAPVWTGEDESRIPVSWAVAPSARAVAVGTNAAAMTATIEARTTLLRIERMTLLPPRAVRAAWWSDCIAVMRRFDERGAPVFAPPHIGFRTLEGAARAGTPRFRPAARGC